MKINCELPNCLLELNNDLNEYDFVLFHLYKSDPIYKKYYKEQRLKYPERLMIFDNSAYEFYIKGEVLNLQEYTIAIDELKPEKPEFEVTKRPKERGEGNTYYKKGDPNKTTLGPKDSPIVQNAIKAQVIYKKKLAAWQKNNPGVSEACEICNSKYMPLKVYMIKCSGILWN